MTVVFLVFRLRYLLQFPVVLALIMQCTMAISAKPYRKP